MKEVDIPRIIFSTCDDDLALLQDEFKITPKSTAQALETIKDWYKKQPHLPPNAIDDHTMARYFVSNKGSIERVKEKIDNMMSARSAMPEFFTNRDPYDADLCGASDVMEIIFTPGLNKQRKRILVIRYTGKDPSSLDVNAAFKQMMMMADMRMRYDTCSGDIYVFDMRNLQFGHLLKTTPSVLKKTLFLAQNCYCSRIHALYMVNMPSYARNTLAIIKSLLKKKIADRIRLVDDLEQLHKELGKEYLPADLGGAQPTCRRLIEQYVEAMRTEEWIRWFKQSETLTADESKRPLKSVDRVGDMLGITGSFKRLDID